MHTMNARSLLLVILTLPALVAGCTKAPGWYQGSTYGWRCENDWPTNGSNTFCHIVADHLSAVPQTNEWCIWQLNQACAGGGDSGTWCQTSGNANKFNNAHGAVEAQLGTKLAPGEILGMAAANNGICNYDSASYTTISTGVYLDRCATSSVIWRWGSLYGKPWSTGMHQSPTSGSTLSCTTSAGGTCSPTDGSGAQNWAYGEDQKYITNLKVVKCADINAQIGVSGSQGSCCSAAGATTTSDGSTNTFYCNGGTCGTNCPGSGCTKPDWTIWKNGFMAIDDYTMNYITTECSSSSDTTTIIIICCVVGGVILIGVVAGLIWYFKCRNPTETKTSTDNGTQVVQSAVTKEDTVQQTPGVEKVPGVPDSEEQA